MEFRKSHSRVGFDCRLGFSSARFLFRRWSKMWLEGESSSVKDFIATARSNFSRESQDNKLSLRRVLSFDDYIEIYYIARCIFDRLDNKETFPLSQEALSFVYLLFGYQFQFILPKIIHFSFNILRLKRISLVSSLSQSEFIAASLELRRASLRILKRFARFANEFLVRWSKHAKLLSWVCVIWILYEIKKPLNGSLWRKSLR